VSWTIQQYLLRHLQLQPLLLLSCSASDILPFIHANTAGYPPFACQEHWYHNDSGQTGAIEILLLDVSIAILLFSSAHEHSFADVTAVLFVVNLSGYDRGLEEYPSVVRQYFPLANTFNPHVRTKYTRL
jgi:hypothetical protein